MKKKELERLKEKLIAEGFVPEKFEKLIEDMRREDQEAEDTLSVKEAASFLFAHLGSLTENWNESKVRRCIVSGELKPVDPNAPKKIGYKIHRSELERFVKEEKMTKEDWKNLVKQMEKQLSESEKALTEERQRNAELEKALAEARQQPIEELEATAKPETPEDPNQVTMDIGKGADAASSKGNSKRTRP